MNNYIICADIHGRDFWKKAIEGKKDDEIIIFLGDYLEPYTDFESITHQQAYENFLEIIEYKKNHIDDCILLLGNHDFACFNKDMISCRHDYSNHERNRKLFMDNMSLFKLCHKIVINEKEYWFSHSGIHKSWFELLNNPNEIEHKEWWSKSKHPVDFLNEEFEQDCNDSDFLYFLGIYSNYRGWSIYKNGSCIWADCREWTKNEEEFDAYQIFGHTMLNGEPIVTENWANLDCKRAFRLDCETGKILELSGEEVEIKSI